MNKKISDLFDYGDGIVVTDEISKMFDPEEIKELTMRKIHNEQKVKRIKRPIGFALAATLVLAFSITALAAAGVLQDTFGLWIGTEKIEFDPLTIAEINLDALNQYAEDNGYGPADFMRDGWIAPSFADERSFSEVTGLTLSKSSELALYDIGIDVWSVPGEGKLWMLASLDGETASINAIFLYPGYTEGKRGYGTEQKTAYSVYRYGDGKKAYFVKDQDAPYTRVYFSENRILYQLSVEQSANGKSFAKKVINHIAGIDG